MAREINTGQNYVEKLLRLIPSEIVAAYLVISGIIPYNFSKWGFLIISVILLAIIPFYLWRILNVKNKLQIISTAIAFAIWMYSLNGGPFFAFGLYKSWLASIILIIWTLIMPIIIVPKDDKEEKEVKKNKTGNYNSKKK